MVLTVGIHRYGVRLARVKVTHGSMTHGAAAFPWVAFAENPTTGAADHFSSSS